MHFRVSQGIAIFGMLILCAVAPAAAQTPSPEALETAPATEGGRIAQEWLYAGDIAVALGDDLIAHEFYAKAAEVFADTPHGRVAKKRARATLRRSLWPKRSPSVETPFSWVSEALDLVTWP